MATTPTRQGLTSLASGLGGTPVSILPHGHRFFTFVSAHAHAYPPPHPRHCLLRATSPLPCSAVLSVHPRPLLLHCLETTGSPGVPLHRGPGKGGRYPQRFLVSGHQGVSGGVCSCEGSSGRWAGAGASASGPRPVPKPPFLLPGNERSVFACQRPGLLPLTLDGVTLLASTGLSLSGASPTPSAS